MGITRGQGGKTVLLVICIAFAVPSYATCTGPQDLVAKLRTQRTTDNSVLLGSWFASHKEFDCALETFRTALKTNPNSGQLHYLEGLALIGAGRPKEAIPALEESVRLAPQVVKPHLMLAYLYNEAGRQNEAEAQWKKALAIEPSSEQALEGLSAALLAREDYGGTIALLRSAPRTERLAIKLATALGRLNYLDDAAQVLTEAMQQTPDSLPLVNAMTVVLVKQLRYQEAINLVGKAVQQHPDDIDEQVQLFKLLVLTNRITAAKPMGPKLLALRPKDPEVLWLNGVVERSVGDHEQAKAHLEAAVALDPNSFYSRYNLGMVLVFLKEWKEAKEQLEKALALGAPEPEVHFELAKALRGLGDNDGARTEMQHYQQLKKDEQSTLEASTTAAQGDQAMKDGKTEEAVKHFREAVEDQPKNATYRYKLSLALEKMGDLEGERAQLEEVVKLDPELADAQKGLGYLLARSGDASGAIEHFRMAVKAAPNWVDAWINLAAELAINSQVTEAREAAAKALALDPQNADAKELNEQLARLTDPKQSHP